jgi:hypothetical protein
VASINPRGVGRNTAHGPKSCVDWERGARKTGHQDEARGVREPAYQLSFDASPDETRGRQDDQHRHGPAMSIVGIDEKPAVCAEPQATTARARDQDAAPFEIARVVEAGAEGFLDLDQDRMERWRLRSQRSGTAGSVGPAPSRSIGFVCKQTQRFVEAHEFRLGEDRFMGDLTADAMRQEPVDLLPIPRLVVAPELVSGEAEPNVDGYLDARFLPDLATSSICGALALLDVALGKSPFMTAPYQKTRPLVDHDRTCRVVKDVSSPRRDHCVHSVASKNKDGLRTRSPEAITRVSGKLRELHRAFN